MPMDFFGHQEAARKKTGLLILFFGLAVIGIVVLLYMGGSLALHLADGSSYTTGPDGAYQAEPWLKFRPGLAVAVVVVVGLIVGVGSAVKTSSLSAGGKVVAEALKGRRVLSSTKDFHEKKLLNVVEEMAIASGVPVPPVYVMDQEDGINAFAAGTTHRDAVIGVTTGCIRKLNREELQGVIAHEFSHILNGDMRMNIRLIGIIHGILVIGILGYITMQVGFALMRGSSRSRSSKEGGGAAAAMLGIALLGALCWLIGYLGTFFGSIIKAAVSRQREYLADASAVQFTRHPRGIGGALKKIGGFPTGSRIKDPHSREISHMFFGQAFSSFFGGLYATHPPLPERIRRIDPRFSGRFEKVVKDAPREPLTGPALAGLAAASGPPVAVLPEAPEGGAVEQIGRPTQAHVAHSRELIEKLPAPLREAAGEPYGARAVIYALLLNREPAPRRIQFDRLKEHADPGAYRETRKLAKVVDDVDPNARLPLIDLAIPTLGELTKGQYETFKGNAVALIHADEAMDPFEWVLWRIILRHLEPHFRARKPRRARYRSLGLVAAESSRLLSLLAYVGASDEAAAAAAFGEAASALAHPKIRMLPREECTLATLDKALVELARLGPKLKRLLLDACAACITADRKITVQEGELFRAVADTLDCPTPPLLPGQPLA